MPPRKHYCFRGTLVALLLCQTAAAAPLSVVNSINDIWGNVAMQAAEATIQAIQKQTGLKELSLRDVPMESFQVCVRDG